MEVQRILWTHCTYRKRVKVHLVRVDEGRIVNLQGED
jgi:hypothetical protein